MNIRSPRATAPEKQYRSLILVSLISFLAAFRLWKFIDLHAVNLLFWDQIDIYGHLYNRLGFWELFTVQHGPPRLGLGMILTKFLAEQSDWNVRWEGFFIFGIVCSAMLLGLALKWRLFRSLSSFDVVIPLIFLTMSQWDIFVSTPMMSHGALPLLLIFLFCHAWVTEHRWLRYGLVLAVNFLLIYTGFGIFMGAITPILLAFESYFFRGERTNLRASLLSLFFAVGTIGLFLHNYRFMTASHCFVFPHPRLWEYPVFVGLMFSNFCGINGSWSMLRLFWVAFMGLFLLTAAVLLLVRSLRIGLREQKMQSPHIIISILIGFTLIFACNVAVGRICMGMNTSQSPRYMTLLIPAFFGAYCSFLLLSCDESRTRAIRLCGGRLLFAQMEKLQAGALVLLFSLVLNGHRPVSISTRHPAKDVSSSKRKWAECYRRLEDIRRCDAETGFSIFPDPEQTRMKEKLDFMKRNRLNLFSEP